MTPDERMAAAIEVAEEGMAAGELPIGAVVVAGDEIVGRDVRWRRDGPGRHWGLLRTVVTWRRRGRCRGEVGLVVPPGWVAESSVDQMTTSLAAR